MIKNIPLLKKPATQYGLGNNNKESSNSNQKSSYDYGNSQSKPIRVSPSFFSGQRILELILVLFCLAIVVPTLTIHLIKSPSLTNDVLVWGISYFMLFNIYLLGAVLLFIFAMLYLRVKTSIVVVTLVISLFCAIPAAVSLRQGLSLQEAILGFSFFSNWPYFLKPMYILAVVLLPIGSLIFLFLQIRSFFSQEKTYAFFGAIIILAIASYLGSYQLTKSGQPTLLTLISSMQQEEQFSDIDQAKQESSQEATTSLLPSSSESSVSLSEAEKDFTITPDTSQVKQDVEQTDRLQSPLSDLANQFSEEINEVQPQFTAKNEIGISLLSLEKKINNLATFQSKNSSKNQHAIESLELQINDLTKKIDIIITTLENSNESIKLHPPSLPATSDESASKEYNLAPDSARY